MKPSQLEIQEQKRQNQSYYKQPDKDISFAKTRYNQKGGKSGHRSSTMTNSLLQPQYPFGGIEEETKSAYGRDDVNRKSASLHSGNSSDTFVSAPDSPNAQKRIVAEQKLRKKKQKQNEKKFTQIRTIKD